MNRRITELKLDNQTYVSITVDFLSCKIPNADPLEQIAQ